MTHLQNIPHILQYGITHISSPNRNPDYVPIGDGSLINARNSFVLPNTRKLGDYIPFYFGSRMPMLYVIQQGFNGVTALPPPDIVYCISTVAAISQNGLEFVFTDGHAVDGFTSFYTSADVNNIDQLIDKTAIQKKYWRSETDLDLKRRKEAEFLVLGDIPAEALLGFVVYNTTVGQQIKQMPQFGNKKFSVKPDYYF